MIKKTTQGFDVIAVHTVLEVWLVVAMIDNDEYLIKCDLICENPT